MICWKPFQRSKSTSEIHHFLLTRWLKDISTALPCPRLGKIFLISNQAFPHTELKIAVCGRLWTFSSKIHYMYFVLCSRWQVLRGKWAPIALHQRQYSNHVCCSLGKFPQLWRCKWLTSQYTRHNSLSLHTTAISSKPSPCAETRNGKPTLHDPYHPPCSCETC